MSDTASITVTAPRVPVSTEQYLRSIKLTVGSATEVIDLSQLRIVFSIVTASQSTPRQLNAKVYNVAPDTANRIQKEFTTVTLSAGYGTNMGIIFSGSAQQKRQGRESAVDTFLDIFASDGYEVIANGVINQTLAAGWSPQDFYRELINAGSAFGLRAAQIVPPNTPKSTRPLVLSGSLKDKCDQLAAILGMRWVIENGALTFVVPSPSDPQLKPADTTIVQSDNSIATVLSPSTGLIGIPTQTLDGIEATTLLNPHIKPGRYVKIDQSLILAGQNSLAANATNPYPTIATDGIYRVSWTEHSGDTRGQPWYTSIVADALNGLGTVSPGAIEKTGFAGNS